MKKNIILLLIDSMNNSRIKESSIELTPFINSLKKQGVYCDSMYSQAPYTEAANMSIYCGMDVLDYGGYMFRYKDAPRTIFEVMKEAGYKTYYNDFQPQCHPSSVRRGIDNIFYSVGYDLEALWSYRLSHYADLYKTSELKEEDYFVLEEIFEDNLKEWIQFVNDLIHHDKSTNMICHNTSNYNAIKVKQQVLEQYKLFCKDKRKYINDVLLNGKNHDVFKISPYRQNYKTKNREVVQWIKKAYKPLMKKIKRMDFTLNMRNCKGLWKGPARKLKSFIIQPNKINWKNFLKSGYLVWNQLFDSDLIKRIKEDCDNFKNAPSLRTHIDHYINWAVNQKEDVPHFAFMHVDDIHNPEVFFTYDSSDKALLKKELYNAEELLRKIPKDYYGSLSHDLSLQYIDNVIKYLYDELKRTGLDKNTYVCICADHGFSFSGNPLRDSFVINLYLENYNIPLIITEPGLCKKEIQGLHASKDIPATLCGLAGKKIPAEFKGIDLLHSEESYSVLQIEYCGGGCPDLSRRELKLAAYDKKYFVGVLVKLDDKISLSNITEIYNLQKDPKQYHNLVNSFKDLSFVQYLIDALEKRKKEIKESYIITKNKFLADAQ